MARIRTIKPEFFRSRTIDRLTLEQRLTFIGLWTHCDDEGRCEYDARLVKADIWPLSDRTAADVDGDIQALIESSLITHYVVGERSYIQIRGWREHQKINRPTPSKLPPPEKAESTGENTEPKGVTCSDDNSLSSHGGLGEDSPPEGNREQGTGKGTGKGGTTPSSPATRKRAAHPLPDDWAPTDKHTALATEVGVDLNREAFRFRNHARQNDRRVANWNAAFNNWLAKAAEYRPASAPTRPSQPFARIAEQ